MRGGYLRRIALTALPLIVPLGFTLRIAVPFSFPRSFPFCIMSFIFCDMIAGGPLRRQIGGRRCFFREMGGGVVSRKEASEGAAQA